MLASGRRWVNREIREVKREVKGHDTYPPTQIEATKGKPN
jgi:hypothetical protein